MAPEPGRDETGRTLDQLGPTKTVALETATAMARGSRRQRAWYPVPIAGSSDDRRASGRLSRRCLIDPDHVARRIAERAVARPPGLVDGLLQHLGAGCPDPLEGPVEIVDTEDGHGQDALGQQFLHGVAVGLGPAGMRFRQDDLNAWLVRAAEGDPAVPAGSDVIVHIKAERVSIEADGLIHIVDGDVAVLECDRHAANARRRRPQPLLYSCSARPFAARSWSAGCAP
jgi:hypothetical protein